MLVHLLEHIGDLSHRAQQPNGRALVNVDDKIKLIEATEGENRWTLEQEFEEGYRSNIEYRLLRNDPELMEIENNKSKKWAEIYTILRSKLNLDRLRDIIHEMRNWLVIYKSLKNVEKREEMFLQPYKK